MITPATRMILTQRLGQLMAKKQRKGFTLIELLVVVVIIGILASVALPSFVGAQDKARNSAVQGNINTVRMALEQYSTDNNGSYPVSTANVFVLGDSGGVASNNYLPGNKLPKSPWGTTSQTSNPAVASPMVSAASVAQSGTSLPEAGKAILGTGGVTQTPTAITHYGAVTYDIEPGSMTYVLYGTGKKGRDAIVATGLSNAGQ
ncbi:MAG: type II secretion system protein [Candidatus Sericytochromatia bacterium]